MGSPFFALTSRLTVRPVPTVSPPDSTMSEAKTEFEEAAAFIKDPKRGTKKKGAFSQNAQLELYGLFKQAQEGENTTKKPGFFSPAKKAKWSAWSKRGKMPKEEAMKAYVQT